MNFNDNFRLWLSNVPIQNLRERMMAWTDDDWGGNAQRAEKFAVHAASQSIPLIYDEVLRHADNRVYPAFEKNRDVVEPILSTILERFPPGSRIVRALLVRLRPGSEVLPHPDLGWSLPYGHRLHVPIVTFPEVTFTVGGECKSMKEGELWEINNTRIHAAKNGALGWRVHLIIDIATPQLDARRDSDFLRFKEQTAQIISLVIKEMNEEKITNPELVAAVKEMRAGLREWQVESVFASDYRDDTTKAVG